MLKFFKGSDKDEKEEARQLFEKVAGSRGDSRELRSARIRMGLLLRTHIDKTFVAGAEQTSSYQELVALAIVNGQEMERRPDGPVAPWIELSEAQQNLIAWGHTPGKLAGGCC